MAIFSFITVTIAFCALSTWKKELRIKKRIDVLEKAHILLNKIQLFQNNMPAQINDSRILDGLKKDTGVIKSEAQVILLELDIIDQKTMCQDWESIIAQDYTLRNPEFIKKSETIRSNIAEGLKNYISRGRKCFN
jgi:hypothetical protein